MMLLNWGDLVEKATQWGKVRFACRVIGKGYLCINWKLGRSSLRVFPAPAEIPLHREQMEGHALPPEMGVGCGRELCNPLGKIVFLLF